MNLGRVLRTARTPEAAASPAATPSVTVCVPARDEERVIGRLLASLCAQDYPHLEILVIDDHSTDRTASIVDEVAALDRRVRRVAAPPLPDGWLGKNHALHVGSQEARGDLLLFVDADTFHHPAAVRSAAKWLGDADVLVVLSGQEVGSFGEKVVSPFFWSLVLPAIDVAKAEDPQKPDEAMGNGQFALYRASAYRSIGGHGAVRDVVVEDVSLVRRMKHASLKYRIAVGPDVTRTRMYRSFGEVWGGFSKNVAVVRSDHQLGDTCVTIAVIGLVGLAELGPWIGLAVGGWFILPAMLHLAALYWMRSAILRRTCRQPGDDWPGRSISPAWALLQPVGAVLGLLVFCNALRLQWSRGAAWKGRSLAGGRSM